MISNTEDRIVPLASQNCQQQFSCQLYLKIELEHQKNTGTY